jgi:hypothetical protein
MIQKMILVFVILLGSPAIYSQDLVELLNSANQKAQDGKCLEAINMYNELLVIKPDLSAAIVLKGLCYSFLGKDDSTCICFIDGIDLGNPYAEDYYKKYCKKYTPSIQTADLENGKFFYLSGGPDTTAYLIREGEYQKEFAENSKYNSTFKIKWINKLEYSLKIVETNDPGLTFIKKGDLVKVKILKVRDNRYIYYFEFRELNGFGKQVRMDS